MKNIVDMELSVTDNLTVSVELSKSEEETDK